MKRHTGNAKAGAALSCAGSLKEGLIQSEQIAKKFCAGMRCDFAGIIVFISRNRSKIMAQNFRRTPQTHLISASLK